MFNIRKKIIEIAVVTRVENEDYLKVMRLADTWKAEGTVEKVVFNSGRVEVIFKLQQSFIKKFDKDLNLLRFIGIDCKIIGL